MGRDRKKRSGMARVSRNDLQEVGTVERTYINKSRWRKGAWSYEPDRIEYRLVDHGADFKAVIQRQPDGTLQGFIGLDWTEPWFCMPLEKLPKMKVHGGVTYAGGSLFQNDKHRDCRPGTWWIGIRGDHPGDLIPSDPNEVDRYFTVQMMRLHLLNLAHQIRDPDEADFIEENEDE